MTFAENILRPFLPILPDWQFLRILRFVVFLFACGVLSFALISNSTIYGMVESAYKVTLVAAFTPLAFGLYWKRATTQGAVCAIALGLATWIGCEYLAPDGFLPPQFAGWLASIFGMVAGSLAPQRYGVSHRHTAHHAAA